MTLIEGGDVIVKQTVKQKDVQDVPDVPDVELLEKYHQISNKEPPSQQGMARTVSPGFLTHPLVGNEDEQWGQMVGLKGGRVA